MKRKKKRRYSLETLVLSLIFVPPLGFLLLWITARSRRTRAIVLVCLALFMALGTAVYLKAGIRSYFQEPEVPPEGFDISHDSRGRYVTEKVLPFEWTIFQDVIREMRRIQPEYRVPEDELLPIEAVQPERKAFEIVADRHDMYYDEVKGIYLKVTTQLARGQNQ